jgi:tetratricopeptide (TPR) repeat protein
LAVNLLDPLLANGPGTQAVSFTMNARQVRVDTYEYDPYLVTSAGSVGAPTPVQPQAHEYNDATLTSAPAKPGYRLSVVALDGGATIHIVSECGSLAPSGRQSFEAQEQVSHSANPISVDVSSASQWSQCGQATVTVTGRFVVVVYGIDAVLTTSNETLELRSGDDQSGVSPLPPSGPAYVTHRRQQYLYVDGGNLSFPMDRASDLAFLAAPQVQAQSLQFTNARGQLSQGSTIDPIQAASLSMDGNLHLGAIKSTGQGGVLQSIFAGQISRAEADGQPLTFAVAPASRTNSMSWIGVVGMVGLVAAPPLLLVSRRSVAARRRRVAGLLDRANLHYESLRFDQADEVADQALRMAPAHPDVHILKARLGHHLGDLDQVLTHRHRARELLGNLGDGEEALRNAIEAAEETAFQKAEPAALGWIKDALTMRPESWNEMYNVPVLRPILDRLGTPVDSEPPFWLQR